MIKGIRTIQDCEK